MYIGITAEWNPFHEGHSHMIQEIKKLYPETPIIGAMSGSFVQRGEPALFNKWIRAKWALYHGISAVVELPCLCVLQSADIFSEYAISFLYQLGCTHIAFGAESLNVSDFQKISSWYLSNECNEHFHCCLRKGLSYSSAITESIRIKYPQLSQELKKPNNLLGFRYILAAKKQKLPLSFIVIRRHQAHAASATLARQSLLTTGNYPFLPPVIRNEAESLMRTGNYLSYQRYESACLLINKRLSIQKLSASKLFSEGLEHRWFKSMQNSTWTDALDQVKNKRYLYSRLKRIGAALLLSDKIPSPFTERKEIHFARLLAMQKKQSFLLKNSHLPVFTSTAKALRTLPPGDAAILKLDIAATDIQNFCMSNEVYRTGCSDFYNSPIIM